MSDAIKLAIDALSAILPYTEDLQDSGPLGQGWKSSGLCKAISDCEAALAALRAQPESVCPECHCHFTANEVTSPGTTRLVNTAQPDHIVDVNGMVDHSELVKRLRYYATRGMDAYVVAADCDRAADALEAIGETK